MPHIMPRGNIITDEDGFGPYALGGRVNTKFATFLFSDATKDLFTLPEGAEIVNWEIVIETAFNASSSNVMDLGDGTTANKFANDVALGVAGFIKAGFTAAEMFLPLAVDTTFKATYAQSGDAADAGKATVRVDWILR